MERKTPIHDIYPIGTKDRNDIFKALEKALGDDNPFAQFSIGSGFYQWSDNRYQWRQMIAASEEEQRFITSAYYGLKNRLTPVLGEQNAELVFSTPDASYIYYYDDGDDLKILITGWGFKQPGIHPGPFPPDDVKIYVDISWSFLHDGVRIPGYEFGIKVGNSIRHKRTNGEGIFEVNHREAGRDLTIVNLKTGEEHNIAVAKYPEHQHHDFDVTTRCTLRLRAESDSQPIAGESIDVAYNGKQYQTTTDANGVAEMALPYYESMIIEATLRDKTLSEMVQPSGNELLFKFDTEIPKLQTTIEVVTYADNQPASGVAVGVSYGELRFEGVTGADGTFRCTAEIVEGQICEVSAEGYDTKSHELTSTHTNIFRFDKSSEEKPTATLFNPHIFILGEEGYVGSKYPIRVEYKGVTTQYTSDENGIVNLPAMEDGETMTVSDVLHDENVATYTLSANTLEYIFNIPNKHVKQDIKVMFRDYYERPIRCESVRFYQEETLVEIVTTLDNEGCAYFDYDSFLYNKELTATINGSERNHKPIPFTIEENEYLYVLQEIKPKTNWGLILLQILAILVAILIVGGVWLLFEPFCREMFDVIY